MWVDSGNNSTLYYHLKGKWVRQETTGDVPNNGDYCRYAMTEVLDDKMFVLGQNQTEDTYIYCLDLNTWVWTSFTPNGAPPKTEPRRMSSWVYNNKIYFFGGAGIFWWNKIEFIGLFCYNIAKNSWEWPNEEGDIPSPRAWHSSIITDRTVFLFGGKTEDFCGLNDLHTLDMETFRWKKINGNVFPNVMTTHPSYHHLTH